MLTATRQGFESRALLEEGAATRSSVSAPPMTAETDTETGVFLAARAQGSAAIAADAVLFVTAEVAAQVRAAP